eukprot:UN03259
MLVIIILQAIFVVLAFAAVRKSYNAYEHTIYPQFHTDDDEHNIDTPGALLDDIPISQSFVTDVGHLPENQKRKAQHQIKVQESAYYYPTSNAFAGQEPQKNADLDDIDP